MDVSDATILSESETSADANQFMAPLMFKLHLVPMNLKVNGSLVGEADSGGEPLGGCR